MQNSQNIRRQLGSHEILRGRNLHHLLSPCWIWLCTTRYRRTSVSQWPAAYSFMVEGATFLRRLNINFCLSPTVTNIAWQKGETGYVGEVTVDNLTGNRLLAVPPVYCFLLSQCIIFSVTEISLTFCTRNMTECGSGMKRGLRDPWWSLCLLTRCYSNSGTHPFPRVWCFYPTQVYGILCREKLNNSPKANIGQQLLWGQRRVAGLFPAEAREFFSPRPSFETAENGEI